MATDDFTPYSTIKELLGSSLPNWLSDPVEQMRVASYDMYERIYWSVPKTFKVVQRGEDQDPIYIPAARTVVETLHRYMANDMTIVCDTDFGTDQQREIAMAFFDALAARERFYSKFNTNKRMGIIRGDWVFHMRGDTEREEGSRISIETIHPGQLFPIKNEDDDIIGWHVIAHVTEGDKAAIERTTYRKTTLKGGPSPITVEVAVFEVSAWGGPGQEGSEKVLRTVSTPETFPPLIDQLPVYHIPNFQNDEFLWGSSELRGFERLLAAIDQSISDEELELVLNGLGCYATDASQPVNDAGEKIPWDMGPGRVVQYPRLGHFERVTGTSTVAPFQEHLGYLHDHLDEASATPGVAKGKVDVAVAESGIALTIQMTPMLSRGAERETVVTEVINNYLFDLVKWIVAYEGNAWSFMLDQIRFMPVYGRKIPVDEDKHFAQLLQLATTSPMPMLPMTVVWDELREMGWDLPTNDDLLAALLEQQQAGLDAVANRIDGLTVGDQPPTDPTTPVEDPTAAGNDGTPPADDAGADPAQPQGA